MRGQGHPQPSAIEYSAAGLFLLQAFERASGCVCRRPNDFLGAAGELSIEKYRKSIIPFYFWFYVHAAAFIKMKVVVFFSPEFFFYK